MSIIDERLANLSPANRAALQHVREIVLDIVPDAEEVITYNMPGFKLKNKYLIAFDAFKNHLSIFPSSTVIPTVIDQLDGFVISKGTIQFTPERPIPDLVLRAIIKHRVRDIQG